jgi:hypothetical protein
MRVLSCLPTERTESENGSQNKLIFKGDEIIISKFDSNSEHVMTQSTVDLETIPLSTIDKVVKAHKKKREIILRQERQNGF